MSDLISFLKARLDEDEAAAGEANAIARYDSDRILREVVAKRAILARYEDCLARLEDPDYPYSTARDQVREYEDFVLPNLAAAYEDHPGYDPDWRP